MVHALIASPYMDSFLLVRPGHRNGVKVPERSHLRRPGISARPVGHLRKREPFTGCNAGHTFFHSDPHGMASICKVGRDPQIALMDEGVEGIARLGGIADGLLLRQGGCSGCGLSGTCGTCMPLVTLYRKARAPLASYCQHGRR